MTKQKQKLELTWIGKDQRPRLEPRILLEEPDLSYQAEVKAVLGVTGDLFAEAESTPIFKDNLLIQGDNLLALKALEQQYAGKVKCVFIDPPYNTGSAFTHYDDGVEHSLWLTLMRDRLEVIRTLLSEDGSLWITIDDHEAHYLKVLCDEVFGRQNFVANVVWEKSDSPKMDSRYFSSRHDHILVYAKFIERLSLNRLSDSSDDALSHYKKVDEQGRRYYTKPLRAMGSGDDTRDARPTLYFPIQAPDGSDIYPIRQDGVEGRWRWSKERVECSKSDIEWVKSKTSWNPYYRIYADVSKTRPPETIWVHSDVGSNRTSKAEAKAVIEKLSQFDTPKPEKLLERVLILSTTEGDLVLDSFAGSGTTGAVAHKMGRRWIMIELGEHCKTHIVPRLKKVIDGIDQGGISKSVNWQGGGGYRFYRLAPSLLKKDKWGNWVINPDYNPEMLSEAMCKHMGYTYAPSQDYFWQHGYANEGNYIYVTTGTLSHEQLQVISHEIGNERSLLICSKGFMADSDEFPNLNLKKIPQAVLDKCEWDQDDYSFKLNILPDDND